jgi:hypothetical protein
MIDYAYPCMMAEKALKNLHEAMLSNAHDRATEHGLASNCRDKYLFKRN